MSDLVDKARKMGMRKGGTKCYVCARQEVAHAVYELTKARADGEIDISFNQMVDLINRELGTKLKHGAVRNHIVNHLSDLHERIRNS